MGIPSEWLRVAAFGLFWGFFFLTWDVLSFRDWRSKVNLSGLALSSCAVGMFHVFGWNALHGMKAVVFTVATVGTALVGLAKRHARKTAAEPRSIP